MSDPMERYCSSYYDKHGLYNDGFPCPADKYCCQTDDGTKMCCAITGEPAKPSNEQVKDQQQPPRHNNHHRHHNKNHNPPPASVFKLADDPSSFKSHVLTTIQSNLRQQQQQQQMVKLTNYEQDQYQQYGMRPPAQNSLGSIDPASPAVYGATSVPFLLSK